MNPPRLADVDVLHFTAHKLLAMGGNPASRQDPLNVTSVINARWLNDLDARVTSHGAQHKRAHVPKPL